MLKLKELEDLELVTDLFEPDKIYLCKAKKEFHTDVMGPKADFTGKCMAAVAFLMDMKAKDDPGISWEVDAGVLTWTKKEAFNELVEALAAIEHVQWVFWSKQIAAGEKITPERLQRWEKLWVPYSELSEQYKEDDRKWARETLKIISAT